MKCSSCQCDNPEEARFCSECGKPMEFHCPSCGALTPAKGKFCIKCGQNLQGSKKSEPVDYSEPQSYTPKYLADKIFTARSSVEGERKLVTVFFADVANFTSLSEKLDPEEVHQIMDGAFKILMDEIHGHEGTINQFTGDGVMALFGAPLAHEDHAQRACHAALAIQNAMGKYGEKIKKECNVDFAMRIGLNTGHVIVGAIGDNLRMDYTAVGDATNLAARMESFAKPGTVLISENTKKIVREYFELDNLGKFEIKGKDDPQSVYQLIKASKIETRIDASAAKGLTKFVGRKNSMAMLQSALEKVKSGSGQVIGVVGEAGVGKSRLIREFQYMLSGLGHRYLEGRCLHFGGSMAYLPFLDIIKTYFDIKEDDREFIIKKKIHDKILGFDQKLTKAIPAFYDLLSLKVDDEIYKMLDPFSKKERTFEAIRDIFLFESQEKPIVVVVEDLHWIDKTSEDVINYLVGWVQNSKIMLVLLYRPEYTHQLGSKSYYTKIGLDQLGIESSGQLVEAILNGDVVPELRELILNRASGNPLFMEELTHSLLENGSIKQENNKFVLKGAPEKIQVPETIQGIISARMDRLEENLKRTMQVASVIGRDFAFSILKTITSMREDLKSYLLNLQGLEFIYEKRLFPELEYIFKHALIQEVAYNSLLQNRRKEIHEKIGNAIETIYADRIEEFYEVLSYHYIKSENYEKGAFFSRRSATKSAKDASFSEAISYAMKNVSCVEKLGDDKSPEKIIDARSLLAAIYLRINLHPQANEAITPIIDRAIKLSYKKRLPTILTARGSYYAFCEENINKGLSSLSEAAEISKEIGDMPFYFTSNYFIGATYAFFGDIKKSEEHFMMMLEVLGKLNPNVFSCYVKATLAICNYFPTGKLLLTKQLCQEALQLAIEFDDIHAKGMTFSCYGQACFALGNFDEAEKYFLDAIIFCEKTSYFTFAALAAMYLGDIYFEQKNFTKAKEYYQKPVLYTEQLRGFPSYMSLYKVKLERAKVMMNSSHIELQTLYSFSENTKLQSLEGWVIRMVGEILLNINNGNLDEAKIWIEKAIETEKKYKKKFHLAKCYRLYSQYYNKIDDYNNAKENMSKAIDIFKECEADGWVEIVEKELTAL
jgi:class 3 adenylate cyclase/tetratricopeptide (TPR) repeat protein